MKRYAILVINENNEPKLFISFFFKRRALKFARQLNLDKEDVVYFVKYHKFKDNYVEQIK